MRRALIACMLLVLGCGTQPQGAPAEPRRLLARPAGPGALFLAGGGDDTDALFKKFLALAGGPVLVVPLAAGEPAGDRAVARFKALGGSASLLLKAPADRRALEGAWGLWFTGGLPEKLLGAYGPYREAVEAAWRGGAVLGGTSAGAMAWGETVIVGGESEDALRRGATGAGGLELRPGLGLIAGTIVDPHFGARGRFARLWAATGATGALGLGVDEQTAAIVEPTGTLEVIGAGAVTLMKPEPDGQARMTIVRSGERVAIAAWGLAPPR